ncbi:winged helix-turn-helix transcriptional regulator [Candidatus Gracilibacteria bacterium]|nr:winged helix-turn-helix transcriptional regulator [Candidatus Gracilibacteria bacterium]
MTIKLGSSIESIAPAIQAVRRDELPVPGNAIFQLVYDDLLQRIRRGDWLPGERLPSISQLARAFAVSPASVREALRSLQSIGLLYHSARAWRLCRPYLAAARARGADRRPEHRHARRLGRDPPYPRAGTCCASCRARYRRGAAGDPGTRAADGGAGAAAAGFWRPGLAFPSPYRAGGTQFDPRAYDGVRPRSDRR